MSEPRHSLIYNDHNGNWWLEICPEPEEYSDDHFGLNYRYSEYKTTYGSFKTKKQAIDYLDSFQNTGYETPILESDFMSPPYEYADVNDDDVKGCIKRSEIPNFNFLTRVSQKQGESS